MLVAFEEDLAEFYKTMAEICKVFPEFWESASMLKSTRASLYTNLIQDFAANVNDYTLQREVSGVFMQMVNRIRSQRERIRPDAKVMRDNDRFIKEIENTANQTQVMPLVSANTPTFGKIQLILDTTQKRQTALISAYFKSGRACLTSSDS